MLLARTGTFASKKSEPVARITGNISMQPMTMAGVIEDVLPIDITGNISISPMTMGGILREPDTITGNISMQPMTVAGNITVFNTLINGLVAYYKLDETSGDAADSSGAGLTLTNDNVVPFTASGKIGRAADISVAGMDRRLSGSSNSLRLSGGTFYVAYWVRPTEESPSSTTVRPHLGRYQIATNNRSFEFATSRNDANTSNVFRFLASTNGTTIVSLPSTSTVSLNTWYLVRAYYNASGNTIGIAVDNGSFATTSLGASLFNPTISDAPFRIGARVGESTACGQIDEVGIWNRLLTSDEETALWNAGAGRTHPFTP